VLTNAFTALIDVSDVLYASLCLLTALSAIVYYRRRIFSNAWDAVLIGILPLAATRVPGLDRRHVGPERAPSPPVSSCVPSSSASGGRARPDKR
jgi:hypothetical protein